MSLVYTLKISKLYSYTSLSYGTVFFVTFNVSKVFIRSTVYAVSIVEMDCALGHLLLRHLPTHPVMPNLVTQQVRRRQVHEVLPSFTLKDFPDTRYMQ